MPENNKLINNGYLRTVPPHIIKVADAASSGGDGVDRDECNSTGLMAETEDTATEATTVVSPLLGGDTTTNSIVAAAGAATIDDYTTVINSSQNSSNDAASHSPHHHQQHQQPHHHHHHHQQQQHGNLSQQQFDHNGPHIKLPTVVYLGTADTVGSGSGICGVSGANCIGIGKTTATRTTLQCNAPNPYNNSTIGGAGNNNSSSSSISNITRQQHNHSHTQNHNHFNHSEWLLKEPALRRRLLILAIAFTVLGAAIGALAIYFASSNRGCHSSSSGNGLNAAAADDDNGDSDISREITAVNNPQHHQHKIDYAGSIASDGNVCLTEECVRTAASLLSAMDTTADPCDNFFQYACGTWNKKHIIPEDRSSISTFEVLADQQQVILKGVLEEAINEQDNQATIKAKMFYKSCMDIPQIRKVGEGRLKAVLRSLGGWPVIEPNWQPPKNMRLEQLLGFLRGNYSEPVLVELYVGADDKNSSVNILQIDQLPLALPSRDYYLKASSEHDLKAYHRYMTQTAILMGADPLTAAQELNDVLQFEILLVNASLPEADRHDTSNIYKKLTLNELQQQVPELNWTDYLQTALGQELQLRDNEELVSYAMPYLIEMGKILQSADQRVVHNYVKWRLVMSIMTHMIDEYQRERVEFRKILLGIQSERMRWSQCVEWTNKKLGMAVGALFIRDNFNQDSKDTALEMIHTIREAFNELLAENHWMDDETRAVAKEKADTMNERIGYPEILTNATELENEYINLTIVADNFMENVLNILKWDSEKNLQLLRLPVDKEKWTTEPAVVNAFYNPNKNDIVFPAGILQPLFYSKNFPKSLNYGGIGVVIGHEITHGFDDKGRQFDKEGNMMQWWNNATIEAFRERTQCIIDQYSKYKIDEVGMYMNGRMTQGENIADNGGLKQAFRAYKKWVKRNGAEQELPGLHLTHDQLFFLNYAQIWCGSMRPEDALTKIRSSVHSPGFIRVLAPLSNSKDFAKAYQCNLGSPMNPVEKCSVW